MPRSSVGQAKNTVRRALRAIIDREPSKGQISRLWEFFRSGCGYCGQKLVRSERKGHVDHLHPDGPNHISNRVLSCGKCNGDEKRERHWLEFLKEKSPSREVFGRRKRRIQEWVRTNKPSAPLPNRRRLIRVEISRVMTIFDKAVGRLRAERAAIEDSA